MTLTSYLRFLAALLGLLTVSSAMGAQSLPYYNEETFTPNWITPGSDSLSNFHSIPAFSFINQNGEIVDNDKLHGKIYVASFFFTSCPGICPTLTSKLLTVQKKFLGDDSVRILSHSITPGYDTVAVLHAYAEKHKINADTWDLLTGDQTEIYQIAKRYYFASEDMGEPDAQAKGDFLHTEALLLIDRNQRIRGVYNGLSDTAIENLVEDIEVLKQEAD